MMALPLFVRVMAHLNRILKSNMSFFPPQLSQMETCRINLVFIPSSIKKHFIYFSLMISHIPSLSAPFAIISNHGIKRIK